LFVSEVQFSELTEVKRITSGGFVVIGYMAQNIMSDKQLSTRN